MSLWNNWLNKRNPLENIAKRINDSVSQFDILAFARRNVICLTKKFKDENPHREDIIILEYFPNQQNPQMSYYDLHDNIGRRFKESQFPELIDAIKNYFNQIEM